MMLFIFSYGGHCIEAFPRVSHLFRSAHSTCFPSAPPHSESSQNLGREESYLEIGALDPSQLCQDGRLIHAADDQSWHLMTLDESGDVMACLRYLVHPNSVPFSQLTIAHSALAQSPTWGPKFKIAVEAELKQARARGCSYVEMGGWAITESLRCSTEALRMMVTAFALAKASGGALGITNANLEGCSASILRRIGGQSLTADGVELPSYTETAYKSFKTEVLCFDSSKLNPRYKKWMQECQADLPYVPVIQEALNRAGFTPPSINTIPFADELIRQTAR
jgi:hypothetical protein